MRIKRGMWRNVWREHTHVRAGELSPENSTRTDRRPRHESKDCCFTIILTVCIDRCTSVNIILERYLQRTCMMTSSLLRGCFLLSSYDLKNWNNTLLPDRTVSLSALWKGYCIMMMVMISISYFAFFASQATQH